MIALQTEVVDAVWAAVEPLLPETVYDHPLGCHRPRVPDRLCLWGLLIRLTTGASWVDVEAILDHRVSDTTLRARRDEWIAAGLFEQLKAEALAASRGHGPQPLPSQVWRVSAPTPHPAVSCNGLESVSSEIGPPPCLGRGRSRRESDRRWHS